MKRDTAGQLGTYGAAILLLSILGYLLYELVLRPRAGFPSDDMAVILGGADTLRVGHWLKFGYAIGTVLLTAGLVERARSSSALSTLMLMAGGGATALFITSAMLGLNLLDTAQSYYPDQLADARATILIRIVTISLFGAATFCSGGLLLLGSLAGLQGGAWPRGLVYLGLGAGVLLMLEFLTPEPWSVIAPVLGMLWLAWLALSVSASRNQLIKDA